MAIPDRPVSGELIESEWGQAVHDRVFAPKATLVHGTASTLTGTTSVQLDLSTGDDDPGGWLDAANDRLVVPTGADGLYDMFVRATSTSGVDGQSIRIYLQLNGTGYTTFQSDCDTGIQISITGSGHIQLSAGDVLTVRGQKIGGGANPQVGVTHYSLICQGDERGA
jgi:hypothetical protein